MSQCARCKQDDGGHGFLLFFSHPVNGRYALNVCAPCRNALRRGEPFTMKPKERVPVPTGFYTAFEGEGEFIV